MLISFRQHPSSLKEKPEKKVNMSSKCQAGSIHNYSKEILCLPRWDPALREAHLRSPESESSTSTKARARTSRALPVVLICAYRDLFTFMLKRFEKKKQLDDGESCCILDKASRSRRVRRLSKQSSTNRPKHFPKVVNSLFSLFLTFLIAIVLLSLCFRGCLRPTRTH